METIKEAYEKTKEKFGQFIVFDEKFPSMFVLNRQLNSEIEPKDAQKHKIQALKSRTTFKEACQNFCKKQLFHKYSNSFVKKYKFTINSYLIPYLGDYLLSEITENVFYGFRGFLNSKAIETKEKSFCIELAYKILNRYDKNIDIPMQPLKQVGDFNPLSNSVVKKMLKKSIEDFPDFYPVMVVAFTTGMTRAEIFGLKFENIDFENSTINVCTILKDYTVFTSGKMYKNRIIPIPDATKQILANLKEASKEKNLVFPPKFYSSKSQFSWAERQYRRIRASINLKQSSFASFRDTYTYRLVRKGFSQAAIKELLGYKSMDSFLKKYGHLFSEENVNQKINKAFSDFYLAP